MTSRRRLSSSSCVYRSGFERKIGDWLSSQPVSYQYEGFKIPFDVPVRSTSYTPDFILSNGVIIESKGYFSTQDRKKHLLIKTQHPDLDIRFVFCNSKTKIRKGSKTSYGDWCEKNGFKYADQEISASWLKEKPKKKVFNSLKKIGVKI